MSETPSASENPHWLNRTVVGAGVTSALGDIAHEATTAILPGFLAVLGIPAAPAVLGLIEGTADATASLTKLGAGYWSDRLGQRKPIVLVGYALTAAAQGVYALATGWPLILIGRMLAWFGRGIRGPLRDAILAEAVTKETRGRAFGFHRAADTLGAVAGPLLGAGLLTWLHGRQFADATTPFRVVFWLSLIPGFLSVLSFALLVREPARVPNHALRFHAAVRSLSADFRRYLVAVGVFGIGDFAHTLLILAAVQQLAPAMGTVPAAQVAAMLYVWRNVVYSLASFPVGYFADRYGHQRVLVVGYAIGAVTAAVTTIAMTQPQTGIVLWVSIFTLAGLYIAVEDALEASMTADFVPEEIRGTGYGVLGTVNGIGDFISSTTVGVLWTFVSPALGFGFATVLMAAGTLSLSMCRKMRP